MLAGEFCIVNDEFSDLECLMNTLLSKSTSLLDEDLQYAFDTRQTIKMNIL